MKKFLLLLPVPVLPCSALLLWALGIVGDVSTTGTAIRGGGLNLSLPTAAAFKDSAWNKLAYYEQADRDSARLRSQLKNDPFYQHPGADTGDVPMQFSYAARQDSNEQRVYRKLAALQRELDKAPEEAPSAEKRSDPRIDPPGSQELAQLQAIMGKGTEQKAPDPELDQLNGMLEKIMDIQHPERAESKLKAASLEHKGQVFSVGARVEHKISLLGMAVPDSVAIADEQRFYGLEEAPAETPVAGAIPAVIPEGQVLVNGATVQLRLTEELYIGGVRIPKDQLVYGMGTLKGERLTVTVSDIRKGNYVLPVNLSVYNLDGIEGIYVPGAITRDVAKQSAAQSVQQMSMLGGLDPSIGSQAASAGLQAAQSLLNKKSKLVRVTVRAGYGVLLRDNNGKDK